MSSRILLVEDDQLQQSLIKAALVRDGHAVEVTSDGLDAVWRIREGHFDLVLLDYQLPEIDGIAAARLVRDIMGEPARPRLVALTATPEQVLGRELTSSPAFDGVVSKSMGLSELLVTVNDVLRAAPARAARKEAEDMLLLGDWAEFDLPLARPDGNGARPTLGRVLVVEDDEIQRRILQAALVRSGYEVETCADGLTAVRKARESGFDIALIDYELPEIDGLASAKLLRNLLSETVRPRLIAVTSNAEGLVARSSEAESAFDDVVGKQGGLPAVFRAITRTLATYSTRANP